MLKLNIKCHKLKNLPEGNYFFILSKGNNAGKPLNEPCTNCFICYCRSESEKEKLYWLFYALWQGNFFKPFISGSVIPFIQIGNLKQVAQTALAKIKLNPGKFNNSIEILQQFNQYSELINGQIKLIKEAKKELMYRVLK